MLAQVCRVRLLFNWFQQKCTEQQPCAHSKNLRFLAQQALLAVASVEAALHALFGGWGREFCSGPTQGYCNSLQGFLNGPTNIQIQQDCVSVAVQMFWDGSIHNSSGMLVEATWSRSPKTAEESQVSQPLQYVCLKLRKLNALDQALAECGLLDVIGLQFPACFAIGYTDRAWWD